MKRFRQSSATSLHPGFRRGFSLVELMVALLIIGILAGMLLPALGRARENARIAEVKSDMEKLRASITQFKVEFGSEPPSSVTIYETGTAWAGDPLSRRAVKTLWPQFDFALDRDINGDSDTSDAITLDGAECLVFFLGGMIDGTSGALRGFSKNPVNPFSVDSGTRSGPYYEFGNSGIVGGQLTGRLVDSDGDTYPELIDTRPGQAAPYVYFSSYGGTGYRAADGGGRVTPYYSDAALLQPYNRDSFQLISPGADGVYGLGGFFNPSESKWAQMPDSGPNALTQAQVDTRIREEYDNITNFHTSTLDN